MQPRNSNKILMAMKTTQRLTSMEVTSSVNCWGICITVRTKPYNIAPIMIANTMALVLVVSSMILGAYHAEKAFCKRRM